MTIREQLEAKYKKPTSTVPTGGMTVRQQLEAKYKTNTPRPQTVGEDFVGDIKQTVSNIKGTYSKTKDKIQNIAKANVSGEQGYGRSLAQTAGTIAGGISQGFGDVVMGGVKAVLSPTREKEVKTGLSSAVEWVAPKAKKIDKALGNPVGTFIKNYESLDEKSKRDVDALLGTSMAALDLSGAKIIKTGVGATVKQTGNIVKQGISSIDDVAKQTIKTTIPKIKQIGESFVSKLDTPKQTPLQATGQVLQGTPKDIKSGVKAISIIDNVDNIKTYKDLGSAIKGKITSLAKQVDTDLSSDTAKTALKDLTITAKTNLGKVVKSEPVKNALNQLDELYTKIGDVLESANIKELISKAKKEGLTRLEINELAKKYGREFGDKAFGKTGEALTSVNAKMFENTRKALKEISRKGIKGADAQLADEAMSNLYNLDRLVQKNINAVAKLEQRIQGRGLLEKLGHSVSKYADVLTGGSIRGFVGGLLPRGAGYKTLNALDIESLLNKNLKIIKEAIESKSDDEIINILKKLDTKKPALPKTSINISKDDVMKKLAESSKEQRGIYTLDEKQQLLKEIVEPKVKALGNVKKDETIVFFQGTGKKGQYVNTDPREIWGYNVDDSLKVKKVKTSSLTSTGDLERDEVGYRKLKNTLPKKK